MEKLDEITRLQIKEAIENIKTTKKLEKCLSEGESKLETNMRELVFNGAIEWREFVENLSIYDPDYDRILHNKTSGHKNFSMLHGCG